jgi:hypothetical protein
MDNQMIKPEPPAISRPYAIGVSIGALVLTFFSMFWAFEAISNWPQTPPYFYTIISQPVLWITIFAASRLNTVMKIPPPTREDQIPQDDGKKTGIIFGVIFAVEFVLIAVAAAILNALGRPLLIPIVVALIVGLHFFPLARLFDVQLYSVTGFLCVVCALGSLFIVDEALRLMLLGLSIAVVLWGSAVVVLLRYTGFKAYSLAFFDRHLMGKSEALLNGSVNQYPEVIFERI